jgi:hypothetical protein
LNKRDYALAQTKALGHQVTLATAALSAGHGLRQLDFKMQCIIRFAARWASKHSSLFAILKKFWRAWNLRLVILMNFWRKRTGSGNGLRHDFVIGPQPHSDLFGRPARVYYCIRCKFSFLVCGSKVAVLNEDEVPITGEESLRRFNTFGEGPCPVLEAFVSATTARAEALRPPLRSKGDGPVGVAPVAPFHMPPWAGKPRPRLRLLTRVREDFVG